MSQSLKGVRPPRPEPGVIEVTVAGRAFKAVAPADDSAAGRDGVSAFLIFCSDECGHAFGDAWTTEHGTPS